MAIGVGDLLRRTVCRGGGRLVNNRLCTRIAKGLPTIIALSVRETKKDSLYLFLSFFYFYFFWLSLSLYFSLQVYACVCAELELVRSTGITYMTALQTPDARYARHSLCP